jgi:hypothetical protein
MAYGIGVGREGFTWQGKNKITRKAEWPGWTPPQVMRDRVKRQEGRVLPAYMPGGPDNPLGARACTSARPSTASTAPTSPGRSARQCRRVASGWPTRTSNISMTGQDRHRVVVRN